MKPKKNEEFNRQIIQGKVLEYGGAGQKLKAEGPIEIVCDLHAWMKAWGFIVEHPYYAVTDATGAWKLDEVPAGTYDLVAWHEKSAAPSDAKSVTVAKGGRVTADLTVNADGTLAWK